VVPQHRHYARLILKFGYACWFIGEDLAEAFYQLPSMQNENALLTTSICGKLMAPNSLGMGLRPSAYYCQLMSETVCEVYDDVIEEKFDINIFIVNFEEAYKSPIIFLAS
jgi:hypothetical protein